MKIYGIWKKTLVWNWKKIASMDNGKIILHSISCPASPIAHMVEQWTGAGLASALATFSQDGLQNDNI